MIDQSHNVTDPIESLMQSAIEMQRAYAQALLVDRSALEAAQEANDALGAHRLLKAAFVTDVSPILAEARRRNGGAIDPIAVYRKSQLPRAQGRGAPGGRGIEFGDRLRLRQTARALLEKPDPPEAAMSESSTHFAYISGLWQSAADRGRAWVGIRRPPPPLDVEALIDLCRKLLSGRGEASGAATASALLAGFAALTRFAEARLSHAGQRCVRPGSRRATRQRARVPRPPDSATRRRSARLRRADPARAGAPFEPRARRHLRAW